MTKARRRHVLLALLLGFALAERLAYGISDLLGYSPILNAATAFPLYQPLTFAGLAAAVGFERRRSHWSSVRAPHGLRYPAAPLRRVAPAGAHHLFVLVAESLRADMLTPDIMPNTWAFARQGLRFTRHYSGGNGTRMGLFTLFYGLYGNYWFEMLNRRQPPLLMDRLRELDYRFILQTSARFSYPEFDQTLFAGVSPSLLHEAEAGPGWQRDRDNTSRLLAELDRRDPQRPVMVFQFFESPHARYYFPDDSIIRKDYLAEFNYATVDLERDISLIKNRYINAVHHLDRQLGRIYDYLVRHDLLPDSIVVVTGDHGEEFMEKGHWGHNSEFTQEQTHVPLVLSIPGTAPAAIDGISSHLDLAPTLLRLLGVENPPQDFSMGIDLLGGQRRDYLVFSDWNRLGIADGDYKLTLPLGALGMAGTRVTDGADRPLADAQPAYLHHRERLAEVMHEMARFQDRAHASARAVAP